MATFLTAALYKFVELSDFADLKPPLIDCCNHNNVRGTILLAAEGINGTIADSTEGVRAMLEFLRSDARFADRRWNFKIFGNSTGSRKSLD